MVLLLIVILVIMASIISATTDSVGHAGIEGVSPLQVSAVLLLM